MTPFKKYYIESLQLTESPMRVGLSYRDYLDDRALNVEEAQKIITNVKQFDTLEKRELKYDLYRDDSEGTWMDYWLTLQPFIVCYFIFKPKTDGGLQSVGVWNDRMYKATARGLFFDYYLQKFPYIQSDNRHTTQGEIYWKRLIAWAADRGHKIIVCDRKGKEHDINDAETYWGNVSDFADYTFKIYAK